MLDGTVYAFKTDTVWGFGCHPKDEAAIKKIYEIKSRDKNKPLILMSNRFEPLKKYITNIPEYAYDLIEKYLPGGLTLIFEKSEECSCLITPFDTVGIRIPNSIDFSNLVDKINGNVLATTSCNISNETPVKNYNEAYEKFSKYARIIKPDNDNYQNSIPSTVILCEKEDYKIIRKGAINL